MLYAGYQLRQKEYDAIMHQVILWTCHVLLCSQQLPKNGLSVQLEVWYIWQLIAYASYLCATLLFENVNYIDYALKK